MDDSCENLLEIEVESLAAIYVNELTYSRNSDGTINKIELQIHPATGHDTTKQYVCMTLVFTPTSKYPDEPPEIEIRNPRGVGEEEISSLVEDMLVKGKDMRGASMMYDLIEMAKDSLTEGNIPHCPCVVCLEHFHNHDSFHRTACYHYFHTHCLNKYLLHTRAQIEEEEREVSERRHLDVDTCDKNKAKKIICPVCRSQLDEESLAVTCSVEELEKDEKAEDFVVPPSLKEQQLKMAEMYERQKAKGGIIDVEHERNKYLLNAEDRMPLRSQTLTPVTSSEDTISKSPSKHDTREKNKERSRGSHAQSGSSQQYKNKGRVRGHGGILSGKPYQELYNLSKNRLRLRAGKGRDSHGFVPRPRNVDSNEGKSDQPARSKPGSVDSSDRKGDQHAISKPRSTEGLEGIDGQHSGSRSRDDRTEGKDDQPAGSRSRDDRTEGKDDQPAGSRSRTPESIDSKGDHPPRSGARKIEDKTKTDLTKVEDFSEGRDTVNIEYGDERECENTRMKTDHCYNEKRSDGDKSGSWERGLRAGSENEDWWSEGISSGNFQRDSRESQEQDFQSDEYKIEQRDFTARTDDSGRDRRGGQRRGKDDKYKEVSQGEDLIRNEKGREVRDDEVNLKSKDDKSSRKVFDTFEEVGSSYSEKVGEAKVKSRENRGGSGGYKDARYAGTSLRSSVKDGEMDVQNDRRAHGASGYDRYSERGTRFYHNDYDDEEYERGDKESEHRMRKEYGHRESGGYQRGGDSHRDRGSESRHKGSKFQDRRDGHTGYFDKSHLRSDRLPPSHSHQYHRQHSHHHRQGQERERIDRQARNVQENRMRDDDSQESRISIKAERGTDTTSETGTQDDEEADFQNQVSDPPLQMSMCEYSGKVSDLNKQKKGAGDVSFQVPRPDNMHDTFRKDNDTHIYHYNIDCRKETGRPEYRDNCNSLGTNISSKSNEDNEKDYGIQKSSIYDEMNHGMSYVEYDEGDNWDDEIDIYAYERHMIRPDRLKEYDREVAPRKKYYQDKVKERYAKQSDTDDGNRIMERICRRVSEAEPHTQAQGEDSLLEKYVPQPNISTQADSVSQQEISYQADSEFLTDFFFQEHSMFQPEASLQTNSVCQPDVRFQVQSVLKLFKKEHSRKDIHSAGVKDNQGNVKHTCAIMSEYDMSATNSKSSFVSASGSKSSQENNCMEYSTLEDSNSGPGYASQSNHVKLNNTYKHQDLDRTLRMGETDNKSLLNKSSDRMSSEFMNGCGNMSTKGFHKQKEHASTKKSDESYKVQSAEVSRSTIVDKSRQCDVFSTSGSKNALETKDECLTSLLATAGSLDSSVPLYTDIVSPDSIEDSGNLHKENIDSANSTAHQAKDTVNQADCKAIQQSFIKNFKKVPPLEFPKKNQRGKPRASLKTMISLADTDQKAPEDKASVTGTGLQSFEHVTDGLNDCAKQGCNVPSNIPPSLTTSTASLPLCDPDLSASLINSYMTSYLLNANLLSGYESGFGLNPNLLSLYNACTGNAGDLFMNALYTLDHVAKSNKMNITTNLGCMNDAGLANVTASGGSVGVQGAGGNMSSDNVNLSHSAK